MSSWVAIINKALSNIIESTGRAVPGAKLRSEVAKVAADWQQEFPPPEMTRFSAFIESFEKDFIVLRRPGSDVLVAPADRADLFAAEASESKPKYSRMRQDIFEAMTSIVPTQRGVPFYIPSSDSVQWIEDGGQSKEGVALPATSLEDEITIRRKFCEQLEAGGSARQELESALGSAAPLRTFTQVAQAHGLNTEWHFYRLRSLTARLRDWSVDKAIPWQNSWVGISDSKNAAVSSPIPIGDSGVSHLPELLSKLSSEDISRISVPLDVVLKLLVQR